MGRGKICQAQHNHYFCFPDLDKPFIDSLEEVVVIRKEKGKPKGRDHLNGIEGFWSYAKHWFYHYRGVPRKYFHLYLKEVEWRFNHRSESLVALLRIILHQRVVKERNLVQL